MMTKNDLISKKFGELTVIEKTKKKKQGAFLYRCKCDCGNETLVRSSDLKRKNTRSCGCMQRDAARKNMLSNKIYKSGLIENTNLYLLNEKIPKTNSSGKKGVYYNKKAKKWVAQIKFQGKQIYLGIFADKNKAIAARLAAEEKYFKPILEKYKKD